jgi:hypothetical protein
MRKPSASAFRVAALSALACAVATSTWAQAQITTGVIQGQVEDSTGAVLPGVSVEARNVDTNFSRTLTTDGQGRYALLQLPTGDYVVTFSIAGFATLVQEGVTLRVGQALELSPQMQVAATAETITVSGTPLIEVSRTEVSNTLNEITIETTPVLGRKFEDLLTLTPGVSIVQGPDGDEITFFGQRGTYNNVSLDGGDYNNGFFGEQVGGQRANIDITLDAIQEFQVVGQGANAEFGRTAGGVINVITKSGTNDVHGSLFHFQRLEELASDLSDGTKLEGFHREQSGGTIGGPLAKDKAFFFLAGEHINGNFSRPNLSAQLGGTPCPVSSPSIPANEALIDSNVDCQRLALIDFIRASRGQEEGQPVEHPISTTSLFSKLDFTLNDANNLAISYNFLTSENENDTFDVPTFGNSANGTEGRLKIHVLNLNLFSAVSPTKLNEFHFTYSRENRPRSATPSNIPADTGAGFGTSFRFGNPFFLQPNVDEIFWRTQIRDNFSIVAGNHTIKIGGEWIHSLNEQTFRGFFQGRYIFDSPSGFIRYASPAGPGGFGPNTVRCADGSYVTHPTPCASGTAGTPLLLYIQEAGSGFPGVPPPGASSITNDELGLWIQDKWRVSRKLTLSYGLRWDAQIMPETVDPSTTVYAGFIGDPEFRSDGTIPDQKAMWQPRVGFAWDIGGDAKSVLRGNAGIFYPRQNMLSQVGSVTANGLQNQGAVRGLFTGLVPGVLPMPVWPNTLEIPSLPPGEFPLFTGVRVFAGDYSNPKITSWNVTYEQQLSEDWSGYVDFTWAKGVYLTRFTNINRADRGSPFGPQLGDVFLATSWGQSLYRGGTIGIKKRFSDGFQLEANYTLAKDLDDDSNERDPFTDRMFDIDDPAHDYGASDRDIRHKFNAYAFAELGRVQLTVRLQARSAQPFSGQVVDGQVVPVGPIVEERNTFRKDNEFFSLDWRLQVPFRFGSESQYQLIPVIEMFNTTNSANNVNPLSTDLLLNFDGFLRTGVGDPRQMQLAMRFLF